MKNVPEPCRDRRHFLSGTMYDQIKDEPPVVYDCAGEERLKNVGDPAAAETGVRSKITKSKGTRKRFEERQGALQDVW